MPTRIERRPVHPTSLLDDGEAAIAHVSTCGTAICPSAWRPAVSKSSPPTATSMGTVHLISSRMANCSIKVVPTSRGFRSAGATDTLL
jgi:hypothetical protein